MTVYQLEKLISGSKKLATEEAASEGKCIQDEDVTDIANRIVNAKSIFENQIRKNNTILWVDDRPNNNTYEREAMELIGFRFEQALSTKEAMALFVKNQYIAIISDMGRAEVSEGWRKHNHTIDNEI